MVAYSHKYEIAGSLLALLCLSVVTAFIMLSAKLFISFDMLVVVCFKETTGFEQGCVQEGEAVIWALPVMSGGYRTLFAPGLWQGERESSSLPTSALGKQNSFCPWTAAGRVELL